MYVASSSEKAHIAHFFVDTDTVTLGTGLTVTKASIGVATTATGFDGVDGILGYVLLCSP